MSTPIPPDEIRALISDYILLPEQERKRILEAVNDATVRRLHEFDERQENWQHYLRIEDMFREWLSVVYGLHSPGIMWNSLPEHSQEQLRNAWQLIVRVYDESYRFVDDLEQKLSGDQDMD